MDSSFLVRQRPPLHKSYAPRDPMPVRGITATELDSSKTVPTSDDDGRGRHDEDGGHQDRDAPKGGPAVALDATASELIQQQEASAADHPAQALQRLRAYGAPVSPASSSTPRDHDAADIEA